jgi:hypothetical protein
VETASELELITIPSVPARLGYRDAARSEQAGLRVVIRAPAERWAGRHVRMGEVVLALPLGVPPIWIAATLLPPSFALVVVMLVVLVIAGGALGMLPGIGRAMARLHDRVAGAVGGFAHTFARGETVLECRDAAEMIVTHAPSRGVASRLVVPARALASLRETDARGGQRLIVVHAGLEIVIADGLAREDARALAARLRELGRVHAA